MDLAQFITGLHIEQVNADLATFHTERKKPIGGAETFPGPGGKKVTESAKIVTEDYGAVLLHLSGGARGVFHVMQMHAGRKNRLYLEVCGTEGSMVWDSVAPELLWHGRRGGPNSLLNRDSSLLSPEVAADQPFPRRSRRRLPRRLQAARPRFLQLHRLGLHWPTPLPDLRRRRPRSPDLRGHRPERSRGEVGRRELLIAEEHPADDDLNNPTQAWPADHQGISAGHFVL